MSEQSIWRVPAFDAVGAAAYDFGVERKWVARPVGRLMWGTDVDLLFDAVEVVGEVPAGAAILDVPCGGGIAFRGLRPSQEVRYVAADISPGMLKRARRLAEGSELGQIEYVEADVASMPFDEDSFDLCVSFNGLHCFPDPAVAIAEIARVLKPAGRLVADCVVRGAGMRQDALIRLLRRGGIFGPGGTAEELQQWLRDAGLVVDRLETSGAIAHLAAHRPELPA